MSTHTWKHSIIGHIFCYICNNIVKASQCLRDMYLVYMYILQCDTIETNCRPALLINYWYLHLYVHAHEEIPPCYICSKCYAFCWWEKIPLQTWMDLQFSSPLSGCTGTEGAPSQWKTDGTLFLERCKTQLDSLCPLAKNSQYLEIVSKTLSTLFVSLERSQVNHRRNAWMETSTLDGAAC